MWMRWVEWSQGDLKNPKRIRGQMGGFGREQKTSAELPGETLAGPRTEANKICHHLSVTETASNKLLVTSPTHTGFACFSVQSGRKL